MDTLTPATITAIVTSARRAERASIRVAGRTVATLSRKLIEELGLQVGQAWTVAVQQQVAEAAQVDKALRQALNRLNRRAMSSGRLGRKLRELGYEPTVIQRVLDRLVGMGVLDDETLARSLIEQLQRQNAGPRLIRARLLTRQLPGPLIDRLLGEMDDAAQQLEAARALVAKRMPSLLRLEPMVRKRRLWGLLGRRGFGGDVIQQALRDLPGGDEPWA